MGSMFRTITLQKWISFWVFMFSVTVLSYSGHGGQSAIVLLITALYITIAKRNESQSPPLNKEEKIFIWFVLIFWGWQLFGVLYQPAGYEFENIRAQFKAFDYPMRWLLLLPIFFLLRRYVIDWRLVAVGISIGAIISVAIAHYQVYFLGSARAFGASRHPIPFGELMVVVDLLLWMFTIYAWDKGYKFLSFFLLIASLIAFYGSLLSLTRGAWLAYVFMIVVWIVYTLKKSLSNFKYLFSTPILLRILFSAIVFFALSQTNQYQILKNRTHTTMSNLSDSNYYSAVGGRMVIFEDAIEAIKIHPFGIGTNNFASIEQSNNNNFKHAHNELLNLWVENGIQGVVSLMALIVFAFTIFWKNLKNSNKLLTIYASCGIMLIISYVISGQSQAIFSHHSTLIFFVFYLYFFFVQIQALERQNYRKQ